MSSRDPWLQQTNKQTDRLLTWLVGGFIQWAWTSLGLWGSELPFRPWEGRQQAQLRESARISSHYVIQPGLTSCVSVFRLQFLGELMDGTWSLACPPGAVVGVRSLAEHQSHVGSGGSRFLQGRNAGQQNRVWQQLSTVFVKIATIKIAAMADCFLEAGNPAKPFMSASFSPPQFPPDL